jgi:hypothetical protein
MRNRFPWQRGRGSSGEWRVEMEYNLSQLALRIAFKAPQKPFLVASSALFLSLHLRPTPSIRNERVITLTFTVY